MGGGEGRSVAVASGSLPLRRGVLVGGRGRGGGCGCGGRARECY